MTKKAKKAAYDQSRTPGPRSKVNKAAYMQLYRKRSKVKKAAVAKSHNRYKRLKEAAAERGSTVWKERRS